MDCLLPKPTDRSIALMKNDEVADHQHTISLSDQFPYQLDVKSLEWLMRTPDPRMGRAVYYAIHQTTSAHIEVDYQEALQYSLSFRPGHGKARTAIMHLKPHSDRSAVFNLVKVEFGPEQCWTSDGPLPPNTGAPIQAHEWYLRQSTLWLDQKIMRLPPPHKEHSLLSAQLTVLSQASEVTTHKYRHICMLTQISNELVGHIETTNVRAIADIFGNRAADLLRLNERYQQIRNELQVERADFERTVQSSCGVPGVLMSILDANNPTMMRQFAEFVRDLDESAYRHRWGNLPRKNATHGVGLTHVLAYFEGRIVGCADYTNDSHLKHCSLLNIIIERGHQGRGIGRCLQEARELTLQKNGYRYMLENVESINTSHINWLRQKGWLESSQSAEAGNEIRTYWKAIEPAYAHIEPK